MIKWLYICATLVISIGWLYGGLTYELLILIPVLLMGFWLDSQMPSLLRGLTY